MAASGVSNSGYEMAEDLEDFELPEDGDDELEAADDFVTDLREYKRTIYF